MKNFLRVVTVAVFVLTSSVANAQLKQSTNTEIDFSKYNQILTKDMVTARAFAGKPTRQGKACKAFHEGTSLPIGMRYHITLVDRAVKFLETDCNKNVTCGEYTLPAGNKVIIDEINKHVIFPQCGNIFAMFQKIIRVEAFVPADTDTISRIDTVYVEAEQQLLADNSGNIISTPSDMVRADIPLETTPEIGQKKFHQTVVGKVLIYGGSAAIVYGVVKTILNSVGDSSPEDGPGRGPNQD